MGQKAGVMSVCHAKPFWQKYATQNPMTATASATTINVPTMKAMPNDRSPCLRLSERGGCESRCSNIRTYAHVHARVCADPEVYGSDRIAGVRVGGKAR